MAAMFQRPVIVHTRSYTDTDRNIFVYYPIVTGLNNATLQESLNRTVILQLNNLLRERDAFDPSLVELQGWFEVKTNQRGILSIALYAYSYTGGAHGLTTIKTLTFDLASGKLYTLSELFKEGADYENVLLGLIKDQVKARDIPVITGEVTPPENDHFYVADKSLVLYYQLYDLAPYVYGITYFPISIYDLQDIIDENGPLGEMLGSV
ncbi:DUF3298 and DUF4163 domain-containing protein [Bacillus thermotolerans]|uniref:DUF3298 and DUF4163 domain-containing protein n=1 Tax=Bacillus thermotolerans TaxID=1221996 RepID=UPI000A03B2CE|nr:DUF3298 and DUF4163 domain-containing protein [Bacillus thermotolerans]